MEAWPIVNALLGIAFTIAVLVVGIRTSRRLKRTPLQQRQRQIDPE